jgi:hypothetical protein
MLLVEMNKFKYMFLVTMLCIVHLLNVKKNMETTKQTMTCEMGLMILFLASLRQYTVLYNIQYMLYDYAINICSMTMIIVF